MTAPSPSPEALARECREMADLQEAWDKYELSGLCGTVPTKIEAGETARLLRSAAALLSTLSPQGWPSEEQIVTRLREVRNANRDYTTLAREEAKAILALFGAAPPTQEPETK